MTEPALDEPGSAASEPQRPGFFASFAMVFRGFGFIAARPSTWPWAMVPALILSALSAAFLAASIWLVQPWIEGAFGSPQSWYGQLGAGIVAWLLALVAAIAGLLIALALAPPLSGPALEKIVERQERELAVPPRRPIGILREIWCGLRAQALAAMFAGPLLIILWLVDVFFPPATVVTIPLKAIITALALSWNLFDYPLTLRDVRMRERLRLVARYWRETLGFGLALAALFWVPCFNVLLLPVGVVAATRIVWQILRSDPLVAPSLARTTDVAALADTVAAEVAPRSAPAPPALPPPR